MGRTQKRQICSLLAGLPQRVLSIISQCFREVQLKSLCLSFQLQVLFRPRGRPRRPLSKHGCAVVAGGTTPAAALLCDHTMACSSTAFFCVLCFFNMIHALCCDRCPAAHQHLRPAAAAVPGPHINGHRDGLPYVQHGTGAQMWGSRMGQSCGVLWRSPAAAPACSQASALPPAATGWMCSWNRASGCRCSKLQISLYYFQLHAA